MHMDMHMHMHMHMPCDSRAASFWCTWSTILECSHQPHIQGRGAKKRTQRGPDGSMQILWRPNLRSYRIRAGTAYCSVTHLDGYWFVRRSDSTSTVESAGAHRQRSALEVLRPRLGQRSSWEVLSTREALTHLSLKVARGAIICLLAEAAGTFSQQECELSGSTLRSCAPGTERSTH